MTENERNLIQKLMKLSNLWTTHDNFKRESIKQEFLREFPAPVTASHVIALLQTAYSEHNADDVEFSLYVGFCFGLFADEFAEILCKLIIADWHYRHEDIASILQKLKIPSTVESLYTAALLNLEYLEYSDTAPLARKCIWALGDIGTDEAKERLESLASSDCETIKEYAKRQLTR